MKPKRRNLTRYAVDSCRAIPPALRTYADSVSARFPTQYEQNERIGAALNAYERREMTARDVRKTLATL